MLKPDFSAKTNRTEMSLSKSNLYHISKRLRLWFGSCFWRKKIVSVFVYLDAIWMWSKPNLAWQLNKANLFFWLKLHVHLPVLPFPIVFLSPLLPLYCLYLTGSIAPSCQLNAWFVSFFILSIHLERFFSEATYTMSSRPWDTEVQLTNPTRGRAERQTKCPPQAGGRACVHGAPSAGRVLTSRRVRLGKASTCPSPSPFSIQLARSAVPSKNTASSDLAKTNFCHLSIFATEIPDFIQLSLEFYNLATYDCNLSPHTHTHARAQLHPLPVPIALSLPVAQTSASCYQTTPTSKRCTPAPALWGRDTRDKSLLIQCFGHFSNMSYRQQ